MRWRKSTFSAGDANCVELAWPGAAVVIRDSKSPRVRVEVPARAFERLVAVVKAH